MLTRMKTASLQGVNGYPVTVETDLHRGMPGFQIVGLADTTIKEAFSRIRPAIINSGYRFPREKVTVNLSPAGKPKEGSHFDLPIALGILLLTLGEEDRRYCFFWRTFAGWQDQSDPRSIAAGVMCPESGCAQYRASLAEL